MNEARRKRMPEEVRTMTEHAGLHPDEAPHRPLLLVRVFNHGPRQYVEEP